MLSKAFIVALCLAQLINRTLGLSQHVLIANYKQEQSYEYDGPKVPSYNISIPVDHFNATNNRTYLNRYWMNDTYYQPGGPIFLLDGGEAGITEAYAASHIAEVNQTSAVMRLAARYRGLVILWEHRYFGESLPIPLNTTNLREPQGGLAGYEYLTIDQALEDMVYFANRFCPANYDESCGAFSPSKSPWIWIGTSYPGMRGAMSRIRSPEVFYAAWVSSAPMQAMYDGSPYFVPIESSLPHNCSKDVRSVIKYADEVMSGDYGPQTYRDLQRLIHVARIVGRDGSSATYNLSDASTYGPYQIASNIAFAIFSLFQAFGPTVTDHLFCNDLESFNPDGKAANNTNPYISILTNPGDGTISKLGIAATYNASTALNAYIYALRLYQGRMQSIISNSTWTIHPSPYVMTDLTSWSYLVYTAFGWFQGSNTDNVTIISKFNNVSSIHERAANIIFADVTTDDLPSKPNVTNVNKYGGWNIQPSNVMFTVGEYDPWRHGSPLSNASWLGAPIRRATQNVPRCNKPPDGTDIFGLVLPGAAHAQDLASVNGISRDGTTSMALALPLFERALDAWLPCFHSA